jgi:hypothetical protein
MIKFYLKIENNMLSRNLLYIVTSLVLIINAIIRIYPKKFINIPIVNSENNFVVKIVPKEIFYYCDVYLLLLFILLIFFFLGIDFNNSMEEISLAIGGARTNKFMLRKLGVLLLLYLVLYIVTFTNLYTVYLKLITSNVVLIPLKEIIFYSITTNLFIISLSLLVLFLSRDIAVSTSVITAFYLVEEALWRCKVTQKHGILGHIYQYYDYKNGEIFSIKLFYMILTIFCLAATYKISSRKSNLMIIKNK